MAVLLSLFAMNTCFSRDENEFENRHRRNTGCTGSNECIVCTQQCFISGAACYWQWQFCILDNSLSFCDDECVASLISCVRNCAGDK